MRKMLIAVYSKIITEELVRTFHKDYEVHTCSRGDDALNLLQRIQPDVLIIMLSLPGITGMEVLQQTKYTPPVIIALTNFLSDYIVQQSQAAGVGALIRLPCSMSRISYHLNTLLSQQHKLPSS